MRLPTRVHRLDLALVLLAVAGTAGLTASLALTQPTVVPLEDLARHEGARVAVEGRVLDAREGARGAALVLAGDALRVTVLLSERGALPAPGDEVRVAGVVGRERGAFTLSARLADVDVLARADDAVAVSLVLAQPTRFAGGPVALLGDIAHAGGGERHVADPHGAGRLPARFPESPRFEGWARVEGVLAYDPGDARYVLEVARWTPL